MNVDLNSEQFRKADEELRKKIREQKYGVRTSQGSTPPAVASLSGIALDFLHEVNAARTKPTHYADILERERKPNFNGLDLKLVDVNMILPTQEGVKAVENAIAELRRTAPREPLYPAAALCRAAEEGAQWTKANAAVSSKSLEIADNYGRVVSGGSAEVISFGGCTAREAVLRLLVDDGDAAREQRKTLLNSDWRCCGVAHSTHPQHEAFFLINFVGIWKDK